MSDVIDFLERLGRDATLRRAPLEQALHGAGLSVEVRAALETRDRHLLETVLGANNVCCLIHVPDVEEAADAPAKQDPARAAA